jgi:hypothetical protein
MMHLLHKVFDLVCFVIGPIVLVFNLFSFGPYSFSYGESERLGITIGVGLISLGFLSRRWSKKDS